MEVAEATVVEQGGHLSSAIVAWAGEENAGQLITENFTGTVTRSPTARAISR